jgi:hypothetical protein
VKLFRIIAVMFFVMLVGCAAHNPPKLGAPPRWIPDAPFGGHYDCYDDRYEYNPQTMKCERKQRSLGGNGQAGIGDQQKQVIPAAFDSQSVTAGGDVDAAKKEMEKR